MPQLAIGDVDLKQISPRTREKYIQMVKYQQRQYYWLMLVAGCVLFFIGALI